MCAMVGLSSACTIKNTASKEKHKMKQNPLLVESAATYSLPEFEKIKTSDFEPAVDIALRKHDRELHEIESNPKEPTFANTIEALEKSGALLKRINAIFTNLKSANSDDEMRKIAERLTVRLTEHDNGIFLNHNLFNKVKAIYENQKTLGLNAEQTILLTETYKNFVRSGALLNQSQKERFKAIELELTALSEKFSQNVLEETKAFELWIDKEDDLQGIPEGVCKSARALATERGFPEKWLFTTDRSLATPFLSYAKNRALRQKMFTAYTSRGSQKNEWNNLAIATKMASLRLERAKLLGYASHAHYVLENEMAKTPAQVLQLFDSLWPLALNAAKKDLLVMMELAKQSDGLTDFQAWDWWYYTELLRKKHYQFDEEEVKNYFSLKATRDGAFFVAQKLFGLSFVERHDLPIYHKDVKTFEVYDRSKNLLGIFYADYYLREGKQGGAWMDALRPQKRSQGEREIPVIINVLNIPKPAENEPILLSFEDARTLFHEFGHALHGLLSDVNYSSLGGTNVPRDFVEFPSQVYENWMMEDEVLSFFAKHHQTGAPLPAELKNKIQAAQRFNQGFGTVEYMAAAYLDLHWHSLTDAQPIDAAKFEADVLNKIGLINQIAPRYKTGYFLHAFSWDYSAGYYSYLWSQVLDADAYALFKERGIFHKETAIKYQKLLASGGSKDAAMLYQDFSGHTPNREALVKRLGFTN